jgi:hypothetical protein
MHIQVKLVFSPFVVPVFLKKKKSFVIPFELLANVYYIIFLYLYLCKTLFSVCMEISLLLIFIDTD